MTPLRPGGLHWRTRALARGVRGFLLGPPPPPPPPPPRVVVPPPPSKAPGVHELIRATPRPSVHEAFRLNLIVPSVAGASTFGGIQTAIDLFRSASAGGVRRRVISVDALDDWTATSFADFRIVDATEDSDQPSQLVSIGRPPLPPKERGASDIPREATHPGNGSRAASTRPDRGPDPAVPGTRAAPPVEDGLPSIPIGPRDVFIATFWPTALFALEVRAWQEATYGTAPETFAYLIQDFEPGFYPRSAAYLLSSETYCAPGSTIAIFNTSLLQREFHEAGLRFSAEFSFEPRLAPALRDVLATPTRERSRTIIVYGRPSKPRNGFGLIVDGLRAWRAATPDAGEWRIVSAGESHPDVDLGGGVVLRSLGKLSMDAYAELLRTSAIGISLMISPHPSYPPLEMSHLGLLVLTNRYGEKDLSTWHANIESIRDPTADGLAADLAILCRRFESDPTAGDRAQPLRSGFLDTGPQFPFVDQLAALLEGGARD
jgi:WsaF, C-terminal domain/WsaF, N-terminal domain